MHVRLCCHPGNRQDINQSKLNHLYNRELISSLIIANGLNETPMPKHGMMRTLIYVNVM